MPSDALPTYALLVGILVVAVVAGLVTFLPADSGAQAQPVGHNASDRLAALDGVNATVVTTIDRENTTNRTVQQLSIRPSTGEMRATSESANGSTLIVSNGSVTWTFDRGAGEVTRIETGDSGGLAGQQGERIERLFARLNISQSAPERSERIPASAEIAPLPVVPTGQHSGGATPTGDAQTDFGLRYEGTDTIDGREVYVLTISTPDDQPGRMFENYTQTMYVDTEWFLPLSTHTEWTLDGEPVEVRTVYRNVTVNPGFDDELFNFEPPENATVEQFDDFQTGSYDSRSALRENVSLSVPDPDIPASYNLDIARSTTGTVRSVSLQYSNETSQLVVSKAEVTNATNESSGDSGESVSIGGTEGTYQRFGQSEIVSWTCDGYRYSVTGTDLSRAMLIEVAESMRCE